MRIKLDRQKILRLLDGFPVQQATEVGLLEFEAENLPWRPVRQIKPTPPHMVKAHREIGLTDPSLMEVWANDDYEVIALYFEDRSSCHLSIKRFDRAPISNWRHFQSMKNEVVGESWEGVQLFPDEARIADNANQYHLFCMPERIPVGFPVGMLITDEDAEAFNAADHPGRQEPWQEGLSTGQQRNEVGAGPFQEDPRRTRWLQKD